MQSLRKLSDWWVACVTTAWGVSLFGVLQFQYLAIDGQHSVCGPWGCGPPLPPLIAYHGFWVVLFSLPTILACRGLDPARLQRFGSIIIATGVVGLIIIGIWDMIPALPHWLPRISGMPAKYIVHRYLLAVATLVDVPIVPITLAGITCLIAAKVRKKVHDQTWMKSQSTIFFDDVPSQAE